MWKNIQAGTQRGKRRMADKMRNIQSEGEQAARMFIFSTHDEKNVTKLQSAGTVLVLSCVEYLMACSSSNIFSPKLFVAATFLPLFETFLLMISSIFLNVETQYSSV